MAEFKVQLNGVERVKEFVNIVSGFEEDVFIKSGKYVVNGKSILGIFSLNVSEELILEMENPKEKELKQIDKFILKE